MKIKSIKLQFGWVVYAISEVEITKSDPIETKNIRKYDMLG